MSTTTKSTQAARRSKDARARTKTTGSATEATESATEAAEPTADVAEPTTESGERVGPAVAAQAAPLDRAASDVLAGKICASAAEQAKASCQLLELIGEFDAGAGWGWMAGMKSMAHWLSWSCSMAPGTAREHVRVARAMRKLPTVTAAFRRGELSYSKVREISRVAGLVDEARLCSQARFSTASQLARTIAAFRTAAGLRLREQERRRFQVLARDGGQYTGISGRYPNDEAALVSAAIQRARDLNGPPPATPDQQQPTPRVDESDATPPYTAADAFLDICRHYLNTAVTDDESGEDRSLVIMEFAADQLGSIQLGSPQLGSPAPDAAHPSVDSDVPAESRVGGGVPAESSVEVDGETPACGDVPAGAAGIPAGVAGAVDPEVSAEPDPYEADGWIGDQVCTVRGGGPVEPETAARHACHGSLLGVIIDRHGDVLALGRTRRLVSKRQRRALMVRDQSCQFPGCHQERHLEAHHGVSWAHGGSTDLDNLLLLCRFHHTAVHEGGIAIGRRLDRDFQAARTGGGGWCFTLPDGTPLPEHGWQLMSAERLTSELIHQRQLVDHVRGLDDERATTIRAVGGGVGFELRSCVDAVFGMLLDPEPDHDPDPHRDPDGGPDPHDSSDPGGDDARFAQSFGLADAA